MASPTGCSVNQILPSGPTVISCGLRCVLGSPGNGNSLIVTDSSERSSKLSTRKRAVRRSFQTPRLRDQATAVLHREGMRHMIELLELRDDNPAMGATVV